MQVNIYNALSNIMKSALWIPDKDSVTNSNMAKFISFINKRFNKEFYAYGELYQWSITDYESFWLGLLEFSELKIHGDTSKIIDKKTMPGAKWFYDCTLNYAENLLRFNDNKTAIISSRENQNDFYLTHKELNLLVAKAAYGLKKLGIKKGSIVAAVISNIPEAVILMLASASIGAVWSSISPDFGVQSIQDRFSQIKPDILISVNGYYYNGRHYGCEEKIKSLKESIPEIKNVVVVSANNNFTTNSHVSDENESDYISFNNLIDNDASNIEFEMLNFNDPLFILYSSGTTGLPKCIVHSVGGTLLQHYKELALHTNLSSNDTILFFTTCGWMMWNWLISALSTGAAVVLYEGNPFFPENGVLWNKVENHSISVLGVSPKYLATSESNGIIPKNHANLSSLKILLSTGAPLPVKSFKYVYSMVKKNVQLSSISGGTDIISCFMLGNPMLPVYAEEIQCRGLGMAVKSLDEHGNSLHEELGELVCTKPFPSMPLYFWNDEDNKKYLAAYFEKFPGIWHHGDLIRITNNGGVIVYGRSDAVLNPGGVRIGTAEIYRVVEGFDPVEECIAVGFKHNEEEKILLFVALKQGSYLDGALIALLKNRIKLSLSPRHIPDTIIQVPEIPKTFNGKKMEVLVSKIINGKSIDNPEAIANPGSLSVFHGIRQNLIHKF